MTSPSLSERLSLLEQKEATGTLTLDDVKEWILLVRQGRASAATASATKRAKAVVRSAEDLLKDFE